MTQEGPRCSQAPSPCGHWQLHLQYWPVKPPIRGRLLSHVTDQSKQHTQRATRLAMAVPPTGTSTVISDRYLDIPTQVRAFLYDQDQDSENHDISLQRLLVVGVLV